MKFSFPFQFRFRISLRSSFWQAKSDKFLYTFLPPQEPQTRFHFVRFLWICFWHLIIIAPPGASLSINKYIFAFAYVLSQYVCVCVRVSLCARVCVRLFFRFFDISDVLFNKGPLETV